MLRNTDTEESRLTSMTTSKVRNQYSCQSTDALEFEFLKPAPCGRLHSIRYAFRRKKFEEKRNVQWMIDRMPIFVNVKLEIVSLKGLIKKIRDENRN